MKPEVLIQLMGKSNIFAAEVAHIVEDSISLIDNPEDYVIVARLFSRAHVIRTMVELYKALEQA